MFVKNIITALIMVAVLIAVPFAGSGTAWNAFFTIVLPYAAAVAFAAGFIYRILLWAKSPVPFRIPTTCGQEKSLPWIKRNRLENPFTGFETVGRMILEVVLFRSLFRNTRMELAGKRPVYSGAKWLWLFGLMFHLSFLVIILRHVRFFVEPVFRWVNGISALDGFLEIGIPALYLSDVFFLLGAGFLLLRRVVLPRLRYISLVSDYFPVLLLIGISGTGIAMRHFYKVDLVEIKTLAWGWVTLSPSVTGAGAIFSAHLLLVSALLAWFPFSKLMHMGGVFLSPTRNLANNSRAVRHINPWNAPVKVHTYEEYEDEYRELMKEAGLPVEKTEQEPPQAVEKS